MKFKQEIELGISDIKPLNDIVLVKVALIETKTKSGLELNLTQNNIMELSKRLDTHIVEILAISDNISSDKIIVGKKVIVDDIASASLRLLNLKELPIQENFYNAALINIYNIIAILE